MKNELKKEIENNLQTGNIQKNFEILNECERNCPKDRDLKFYKCICMLQLGDIEKAIEISEECVRKFPTSYEAYYYNACAYQETGMVMEALRAYKISRFLYDYMKIDNKDMYDDMCKQIDILEKQFVMMTNDFIDKGDIKNILKADSFIKRMNNFWEKNEKATRNSKQLIVGTEYWVADDDLRFIGIYRNPEQYFIGKENMSLIRTQAEFLKFINKGVETEINSGEGEYLIPIASAERNNIHNFTNKDKINTVVQREAKHFNYYRVKNGTQIISKHKAYYGYPIPLKHDAKRKKLVLSFFVDGLSQEVINGEDFRRLMPNTYDFFKKGTVCTNTFSCSEWTFPSLATYESGLDTLGHMMFHNIIDGELPRDVPTLTEYIKEKGYFTSKLDGDWRCIYSYGFARGCDQYVYQIQHMGARAEQEIINVIEHIETFKDTDQYLWMTVGDLHDIADGLDLSLAVQKNLTLDELEYEDVGKTSVKQNYSWRKSQKYKKTIQYFDMLFGILYNYIEKNYKDDEIVISLFADHGQGYLVPNDKHFLSKERTKVAFMFRGSNVDEKMSDEIISTADYLPIMCKLCDIPVDYEKINGRLPLSFGGEKEREYAITESIHPGDKYCAVANANDYEIYFDNQALTDEEGRFELKDYKVYGYYKDGTNIEDKALLDKYEKIFLERIAEHVIYD